VKDLFIPGPNAVVGDKVMFYNAATNSYDDIHLKDIGGGVMRWVLDGDLSNADQGNRVLAPCEAGTFFVHPHNLPVTMPFVGQVRANDFVCPLKQGLNYLGGGWPIDQSPMDRAMTLANGFIGARSSTNADRFQLWVGDLTPLAEGYETHFLYNYQGVTQWTLSGSASFPNEDNLKLFRAMRGVNFISHNNKPGYTLPLPWQP
jgi:large repetitive protein